MIFVKKVTMEVEEHEARALVETYLERIAEIDFMRRSGWISAHDLERVEHFYQRIDDFQTAGLVARDEVVDAMMAVKLRLAQLDPDEQEHTESGVWRVPGEDEIVKYHQRRKRMNEERF